MQDLLANYIIYIHNVHTYIYIHVYHPFIHSFIHAIPLFDLSCIYLQLYLVTCIFIVPGPQQDHTYPDQQNGCGQSDQQIGCGQTLLVKMLNINLHICFGVIVPLDTDSLAGLKTSWWDCNSSLSLHTCIRKCLQNPVYQCISKYM